MAVLNRRQGGWASRCERLVTRQQAATILASRRKLPMPYVSISDALKGKVAVGEQVTVKGWVRTRRDSKGGFSFVAINDGSCFDSIQAVCPNTLPNYADAVTKLTAGCAVEITGKLVQSQGKGQSFEIQADAVTV